MSKPQYTGPFKEDLQSHIELKQAIGYKYEAEAEHLQRFDQFVLKKYPEANCLSRDIVLDWCSKKPYEAQANQSARASILRQFATYQNTLGKNAYILPKGYYRKGPQYVPYIYSPEELLLFFAQTDRCSYSPESPQRHLFMPVFFHMIYQCGLRPSEARLLTVGDVDLHCGVLSIQHSKKDNSRLVPMAESLLKRCRDYSAQVHASSSSSDYFYPARDGKAMRIQNVYNNFRHFLWRAGISHRGRGLGPRIMDFRHTYAVHCLKRWSEQGQNLAVYLPILQTYMGHYTFHDTAYYLRLTADVFPHITLKLESSYPEIIPALGGDYCETD